MSDFLLVLKIALVLIVCLALMIAFVSIPLAMLNRRHCTMFEKLVREFSFAESEIQRTVFKRRFPWAAGLVKGHHVMVTTGSYYSVMDNVPGVSVSYRQRHGVTAVRVKVEVHRFRDFRVYATRRVRSADLKNLAAIDFYSYFTIMADEKPFTQKISDELKERLFQFSYRYGRNACYIWLDRDGYLLMPMQDWMFTQKKYQRTVDAIHLLLAFN